MEFEIKAYGNDFCIALAKNGRKAIFGGDSRIAIIDSDSAIFTGTRNEARLFCAEAEDDWREDGYDVKFVFRVHKPIEIMEPEEAFAF